MKPDFTAVDFTGVEYRLLQRHSGKTQEEIAEAVGIYGSMLSEFASGKTQLPRKHLAKLRRVLIAAVRQHMAEVQGVLDAVA